MIDIDEHEQTTAQENERRRLWQIVQDLEVRLQLGVVVTQRCVTERLPRPTSLGIWQSWLIHEALTRIWQGVRGADAALLRSASAILMAVSRLDEAGIVCSSRLPPFPRIQNLPDPLPQPCAGGIERAKEDQGWSFVRATRDACGIRDEIVLARVQEEAWPIPTTLDAWQSWFICEAIANLLVASCNHDNPPCEGGSAWLFRLSAQALAGSARLYDLGVRPAAVSDRFCAFAHEAAALWQDSAAPVRSCRVVLPHS